MKRGKQQPSNSRPSEDPALHQCHHRGDITATEITIRWNSIEAANSLSSDGQLIPFLIELSLVPRVFYIYFNNEEESC
jgi:hypothetical protein